MFGIGFPELFLILLVALVVFGPEKLPEIARTLGKLSAELKKGTDSVRKEFYNSVYTPADDWKTRINQESRNLLSTARNDARVNGEGISEHSAPGVATGGLATGGHQGPEHTPPKTSTDADHTPDGKLIPKTETQESSPKTEGETDRG